MKRSHPVVGALLLAGLGVCVAARSVAQENSDKAPEYKITPEAAARVNPVKSTPEGLAEARKMYKYDCEMCHGKDGDGKGELVESMKLTMRDWRDPAALTGMSDGEMFYIITAGKGKMIGEGDRQPEKMRWNMVNLVRSMAAKSAPAQKNATEAPKS
jgi:hypothetical protein